MPKKREKKRRRWYEMQKEGEGGEGEEKICQKQTISRN
jgi:hypothetical protein